MLKLILFCIILISNVTYGADATSSHLYINSDDLVIDKVAKIASFEGNVVICFEDMQLIGKHAKFHFKDTDIKHLDSIHLSGAIKLLKRDGTIALAERADYNSPKSQLHLREKVIISQGEHIVHAKEMIYYGKITDLKLSNE